MKRQLADVARLGATHAYVVAGTDGTADGRARFAEACGLLADYAAGLFTLLRPQGRLLNHAISLRPDDPQQGPESSSFIDRYVFPDGELQPIARMVATLEDAGFEVRDLESLREHYALTLRAWCANLDRNWDAAVAAASLARARVWRLYMTGSAMSFESNDIGVNQVLAVRPGPRGQSGMPPTRAWLLGAH